jgi:hypothetical protein
MQEMTFWRRVVQRVVAPLAQTSESSAGRGVAWAKYDFVGWSPTTPPPRGAIPGPLTSQADLWTTPNAAATELICKNLCNGFGLRGAGGQCYAYGVYPAASYFSTHALVTHTTQRPVVARAPHKHTHKMKY